MKEIPIKSYVRYLFGIAILVFMLNKFYLRPWVLENVQSDFIRTIVYSIPNLVEAIIGTLLLTGVLLQLKQHFWKSLGFIKDRYAHIIAVALATTYVLTQEFRIHNLGGNNVFDNYDVLASIIGLVLTFGIIQVLGFVEESDNEG